MSPGFESGELLEPEAAVGEDPDDQLVSPFSFLRAGSNTEIWLGGRTRTYGRLIRSQPFVGGTISWVE
jgi:hypothetical protein